MKDQFKSIFDADYQGAGVFLDKVLKPLFGNKLEVLPVAENNPTDVSDEAMKKARIKKISRVANIAPTFNRKPMEVFDITLEDRVDITRARVGIQQIIRRGLFIQTHAFMLFHAEHPKGENWRFSYALKLGTIGSMTDAKRFTYLFGENMHCRTAIDRFFELTKGEITDQKILDAFNVEALSNEFFEEYRDKYAKFVWYITGKEFVKENGKWVEKTTGTPNKNLMRQFHNNDKAVRDYVKKMMGRITFLHFLQKKGWMKGDLNYMYNLFDRSNFQSNYLEAVLEPLFFGILNTKPKERTNLFKERGWNMSLLKEWKSFPYLNGGLFEEDEDDRLTVVFPKNYFINLFEFYSRFNFTVDENDPDDAEVGVDPEMLGKIFENLLEDNKDKGAFYTPKEIVRYMCQESLTAYLVGKTGYDEELIRAFVIHPYDEVERFDNQQQNAIYNALENVKICDPAIGSGAFPMGLLNELVRCEEALLGEREDDHQGRSGLKKYIIQNNIYGVDIEKGAIDIARLRFWLSIVVDEKEPSPLPNLDYKIMQGNSLLECYKGVDLCHLMEDEKNADGTRQLSFFDNVIQVTREELSAYLKSYFECAEHKEKVNLQRKIKATIQTHLSAQKISIDLSDIDIAGNDKFFLWHTWFSDVFNRPSDCEKGFDIVIGNPPYLFLSGKGSPVRRLINEGRIIDAERLQELLNSYGNKYPEVSQGCRDFYKWFYKMALNICKYGGILAFITPDTFFSMPKYLDLRTQLFQHSVISLVDLGFSVFDAPTVSSAICIVKKDLARTKSIYLSDVRPILNKDNRDQLYSIVKEVRKEIEVANNEICAYKHPIAKRLYDDPDFVGLGNYISFSEGEHDIQIEESLLSEYNAPGRVPVLIDSTMQRNGYVTKAYMLCNAVYQNRLHEGERCLVRKTGDTIVASLPYDSSFAVAHQNVYVAKDKAGMPIKFWMAVLNSTMLTFLYQNGLFGQKGRTMAQFRIYALNALPIPSSINKTFIRSITNYATALLQSFSNDERITIEKKIDEEVYRMYGLSQEDVKTITHVMQG